MLAQDAPELPTAKRQPLAEITSTWAERPLARWHKRGLVILAVAAVLFGVITEVRTALLEHRKGDLNVFLRAAWAIRSGADIYTVTDDNGFHYLYPPLFAIVLAPLADAPAGFDRSGMLPYVVSAALCYALNLLCLAVAVHLLARALEPWVFRSSAKGYCSPGPANGSSPRPPSGGEGQGEGGIATAAPPPHPHPLSPEYGGEGRLGIVKALFLGKRLLLPSPPAGGRGDGGEGGMESSKARRPYSGPLVPVPGARGDSGSAKGWPRGSRGWWALRVIPILVCLPPIGHTLMRGQAGLLLLLLICGMIAAVLAGRRRQAGLWLAGAICLKVIPAFLLIYPLWRRDLRMFAGCAIGLALGLFAIPALVMGPARTVDCYREWTKVMLLPALDRGDDRSRAKELMEMTATDSQSLLVVAHNTLYPERKTRPTKADAKTRLVVLAIGGVLTGITLLAGRWHRLSGVQEALFLGMLVIDILLMSPVCHLHYFCLSLPLVMALIALRWQRTDTWMRWLPLLFLANIVANIVPHFPGLEPVRDLGMAMYAALALWLAGAITLSSFRNAQTVTKASAADAPVAA